MGLDLANIHVDVALTGISVDFGQGEYISDELAPRVAVEKQSDQYRLYDVLREKLRVGKTGRAPGTAAQYVDAKYSLTDYRVIDHAQNTLVADEERSQADPPIDLEGDKIEVARSKILVEKDVNLKTALDASGATSASPVIKWDNNGDAVKHVLTGVQAIRDATQTNRVVMGMDSSVATALWTNAVMMERIKYGGTGEVPARVMIEAFKAVFGVAEVAIAAAYKNTALPGATAVISSIWDNDVYLLAKPERPGPRKISGAYTFTWNPFTDARAVEGQFVRRWRDDEVLSDKFGVHDYYTQKIVSADGIYLIPNAIA